MRRLFVLTCLFALPAAAGSVYLNGVRIDGVTNQKFEKATVKIDEKGNVHIDAPGYQVKQLEQPHETAPAVKTLASISKHYFLVTEQNVQGMTEYDVDLYVNSKFVRKLRSSEDQIVTEITKHLQPGSNTVTFVAKKIAGESRKSFSKEHYFRVIIGEGNMSADHVMIDNPIVRFERTAADVQDISQEFPLTTR